MLIAFTGTKGSGKDTAAAALIATSPELWRHVKMAGGLKDMLRTMLAYQGVGEGMIERMVEGDLKEVDSPYFAGRSCRHAMVTLGTEWGRDQMGADLWVGVARSRILSLHEAGHHVVVSDVRFPNEVEMVKELGGEVCRVVRQGAPPAAAHSSEALIARLDVTAELVNDFATAADFARRVADYYLPF